MSGDWECLLNICRKIRFFHRTLLIKKIKCSICKKLWNDKPGTVYCVSLHGICPICNKPRIVCKCFQSDLMTIDNETKKE